MATTRLTAEQHKKLRLTLRNVTIAAPKVFEPVENPLSHKLEYSASVRMMDNNPAHMEVLHYLQGVIKLAAQYYFGDDWERLLKQALKNENTAGLNHDDEGGYWYLKSKCTFRPGYPGPKVVGRDKHMTLRPEDGLIVSGMIGNIVIKVWCYIFNGKPGISFELLGLQFVDKGEPLAGAAVTAADDDFDDLEDAGGDDLSDIVNC